jgi:hypothetical protein
LTESERIRPRSVSYVDHPAYNLAQLGDDLHRFAFFLGGNDGEHLLEPGPQ